ncbi:retrovirus-related pol polyprotein from transposon TNT 1-94 [Tanacetum coccineum]
MKIEESLNVTFDETPPPSKTSPLVDYDLDEEEAIKVTEKNLENDIEDETLEIEDAVNIKESRKHPLENVIGNLNQRTLRSQAQNQSNFFCFISTIEPKNVNETLKDESWIIAMQDKLNQFIANDVRELVPQPKNMKIIGTKWVYRNKLDENGVVSRNKAGLVAQGYNQQEGIDYNETYAPVARLEYIRILLAYACALDFKLFQMDVKSAFLNGFINEEEDTAYPCQHSQKTTNGMKINNPYPEDSIRRIQDMESIENMLEDIKRGPYSKKSPIRRIQYMDTSMDDPNLNMEEYIRLEEEKAHKHGKVFNWQTATYGKIRVDDDFHNLSSVEAEFPAIVINDAVVPQDELQRKSQVSTLVNDEIDFRISFDESDDEDYTIFFDKNSFSYKMISVNDLKTDSENDNEKACLNSITLSLRLIVFDDIDLLSHGERISSDCYNDAQTFKSDLLTEPILNPQHIDEFDLNDKTSLSEYEEEEQKVLYFNDLFPFNIIRPDNLKSEKDNDDNMALPPREQRHRFLRYEGLEYLDTDILISKGD